jgi:hypothetical protein
LTEQRISWYVTTGMKHTIIISAFVTLLLALSARASHAQTAWRCGGQDCNDDLMNRIEDNVNAGLIPIEITPPPIPMTCANRPDRCPHCVADQPSAQGANGEAVSSVLSHLTVPWSFRFWRDLNSFLFGRYTASMTVLGTGQTFGTNVPETWWPSTGINFSFLPPNPAREVPMPGGGTSGVQDIDMVGFWLMSGNMWSGNLSVSINMASWAWCDLGYPGANIHVDGAVTGPTRVSINYPIAWTPLVSLIADAVRAQYRSAVERAVLQ